MRRGIRCRWLGASRRHTVAVHDRAEIRRRRESKERKGQLRYNIKPNTAKPNNSKSLSGPEYQTQIMRQSDGGESVSTEAREGNVFLCCFVAEFIRKMAYQQPVVWRSDSTPVEEVLT